MRVPCLRHETYIDIKDVFKIVIYCHFKAIKLMFTSKREDKPWTPLHVDLD